MALREVDAQRTAGAARLVVLALCLLTGGCDRESGSIEYVCDEPLDRYLTMARANIANDYQVERSQRLLEACPDKGYHRRYRFEFEKSALLSKQTSDARVTALWCNEDAPRTVRAELSVSTTTLRFSFLYPWATSTGKYPKTEFRLSRNTGKGGFFDDVTWRCRVESPPT